MGATASTTKAAAIVAISEAFSFAITLVATNFVPVQLAYSFAHQSLGRWHS
jgi:hypothetical protein